MNSYFVKRLPIEILIGALIWTPMLGSISGTVAAAQTVQNTTSSYLYDAGGNLTQITDPLGRKTDLYYDSINRLNQLNPPAATGTTRYPTYYSYDGLNQVTSVKDPRSLVTTYTKDGLGKKSSQSSPDTGIVTLTHDAAGNVLTSKDSRGKTTSL